VHEGLIGTRMASRFVFFTKTAWHEPPRLRHQLAQLLAADGSEVLFAEKPGLLERPPATGEVPSRIRLFRHRELLHHKLRIGPPLRGLNRAWTAPSIRRSASTLGIAREDVIVNFNYEYYFLRDLFPGNAIVTIINDDFIARALPLCKETLHEAQRMTCRASDAVLTPSVVLQEQLRPYCEPQLFLPWADTPFRQASDSTKRDTVLYWGFIDWRLDYAFMESLARRLAEVAPEVQFLFVGPTERGSDQQALFRAHPNVRLAPSSKLDALPLDRIFASVIPFRGGVEGCDAIVMPNKAFQLLARGIPLLVTGMPRFAQEPFVFRLDQGDAVASVLRSREQFASLQAGMRTFIDGNGPAGRLQQFRAIVEDARRARTNP
jgi:hypothetical protein